MDGLWEVTVMVGPKILACCSRIVCTREKQRVDLEVWTGKVYWSNAVL